MTRRTIVAIAVIDISDVVVASIVVANVVGASVEVPAGPQSVRGALCVTALMCNTSNLSTLAVVAGSAADKGVHHEVFICQAALDIVPLHCVMEASSKTCCPCCCGKA